MSGVIDERLLEGLDDAALVDPTNVKDWPGQPQPIKSLELCAPSMPLVLLPIVLRPWIEDVCNRMRVSVEMLAVPAVIAIAAIVGRTLAIRPKRYDSWAVVPNLWGCIVGRPGAMKSPAIAEAMAPLRSLEAAKREVFERDRATRDTQHRLVELAIAGTETQIKKSPGQHSPDEVLLANDLAEKRRELEALDVPEPRITTQDATVEKIGALLRENPRGLLIYRDEVIGFLRTLQKPGREGDRQFYLESWNGSGEFTVDRIGRGTLHIPALCTSFIGGAQPGPLGAYVNEAFAEGTGSDGLLQRMQLLVWPNDLPDWKNVDELPDAAARGRVFDMLRNLHEFKPEEHGAHLELGELPFLRFSCGGQGVFDEWRDSLEKRLRSDELLRDAPFESHLSKYRSLMPSLALLFHLADSAADSFASFVPEVSEKAARLAADWCDFLELHAQKVFAEGGKPRAVRLLAKHIENGQVEHNTTIRELYRRNLSGLTSLEDVEAALKILEGAGWVRLEQPPSPVGRPPSPRILIHPAFRPDEED